MEKESLGLFFKEELPYSSRIVRDVTKEKSVIDFKIYHSNIFSIIKQRRIEKSDISA